MPELPEVEAIKNQLDKYLQGHTITSIDVKNRKIFQGEESNLIGGKFRTARRFGKVTSLDFDNDYSVVTHVKMTGQFVYRGPNLKQSSLSKKVVGGVPGPHTHAIFHLDRDGVLFYNDLRRFSWMKVIPTQEVESLDFISKLGPEPFKDLTESIFIEILKSNRRNIKVVLMDQSKIGGVGNIYANDALFLAGIDPNRKSDNLNETESGKLYKAVIEVLERGIKHGGASELMFVTPDGQEGEYQNYTLVYGKEGKDCKNNCGAKIKKIMLGGRGTYFCSNCQS